MTWSATVASWPNTSGPSPSVTSVDVDLIFNEEVRPILENYQQEDGSIRLPEALVPYAGKKVLEPAE